MPIRFRCAYCNQLMGIAHRKAGKVVKCPKCAGEIIVPVPEGMAGAPEATDQAGGDDGFDEPKFDPGADEPANTAGAPSAKRPARPAPDSHSTPEIKRIGVFLSLASLAISVIVVILLLILTFILGLIIGKQSAPPAEPAKGAAARA